MNYLQTRQVAATEAEARDRSGRRGVPVATPIETQMLSLPQSLTTATGALLRPLANEHLTSVLQHVRESLAAGMGVPSVLVLPSAHGLGSSGSVQLRVFNSTVSLLASSVERVLSACYAAIYGEDGDASVTRLACRVSPLVDTRDLGSLVSSGALPPELVGTLVLDQLGLADHVASVATRRLQTESESRGERKKTGPETEGGAEQQP